MWARQNRSNDRAVLLFFLAMFLLREMSLMLSMGASKVCKQSPLPVVFVLVVLMSAVCFDNPDVMSDEMMCCPWFSL